MGRKIALGDGLQPVAEKSDYTQALNLVDRKWHRLFVWTKIWRASREEDFEQTTVVGDDHEFVEGVPHLPRYWRMGLEDPTVCYQNVIWGVE